MYSYAGVLWLIIQLFKTKLERIFSSESTALEISRIFIHLSTTSFNFLPSTVLEWIPQRRRQVKRKGDADRRLNEYWDLATLVVLFSFLVSQGVLVWALCKSLLALYHLSFPVTTAPLETALVKRAPVPITAPPFESPSNELLIQPLIPGLTTSLSALPILISALAISQTYHEWGHALCAASESLSISSTGFYLFFLLLPTFYVSITSTSLSSQNPWRELRVATAGVWSNLQLVLIGWIGMSRQLGGFGLFESNAKDGKSGLLEKIGAVRAVEKGVKVVGVRKSSALYSLIPPKFTTITHLNDLELDSSSSGPLSLFDRYLSSPSPDETVRPEDGYDNLGWCLSKEMFQKPVKDLNCCQLVEQGGSSNTSTTMRGSSSHELCFKETNPSNWNDSTRLATCLDPTPLVSPATPQEATQRFISSISSEKKVQRCLNQASCQGEGDGLVCAKLDPFRVVRIGIEIDDTTFDARNVGTAKKGRREVVIWKGTRENLRRISPAPLPSKERVNPHSTMTTSLISLLSTHSTNLSTLYSSLTLNPSPLIDAHLSSIEEIVKFEIDKQTTLIQSLINHEELKLSTAKGKVKDWLIALGERSELKDEEGEGCLQEKVERVERVLEKLRSRISQRGEQVVRVQKELYRVREVLGDRDDEVSKVKLDELDKLDFNTEGEGRGGGNRWEELDLKKERLEELEQELERCKNEIVRRQDQINICTSEIFTLFTELGKRSPSDHQREEEDLLEKIWLHLGIGGEDKQTRTELLPTLENVGRLQRQRQALEQEQTSRHELIQSTYDKLYPLWTMLGVSELEMDQFVTQWSGSTLDVIDAYQTELDRMMALRRSNLSSFINAEREALTQLYDQLYLSHSERIARFPSLTISVDPERVWRDENGGYEEEIVNENVSEELLIRHEREREKVEVEVEDARVVLERLERYFEVVQKGKDLEAAAADPTRLTARGSSTKLLLEERDRKRVAKEKPKLEAELRSLIPEWESKHRRLFTVDGVPFLESLDEQQRMEEMEKENKRRTKLGTSASSGTTRPLRAQPTGTTTVAPLKRQMTGTSIRSNTSSNSNPPPPAKRQTPMMTGSSTHSSSYASHSQPLSSAPSSSRPRSVLGDSNSRILATPASSMKPGGTRSRSNTVSKMITPTPTGGGGGSGMRIPTGWGGGGSGIPAQMTGNHRSIASTPAQRFRPRPSTAGR
ncbi:hypothetical protein JCM3765_001385 [Sporobolomyces pararoseus]